MLKQWPSILIVGRPNVGKSTLMNRILRKNHSITLDEPGITRDLVSSLCSFQGKTFELLDSGGVLFDSIEVDAQGFQKQIEEKVTLAMTKASKIIFLVDGKFGLHPNDRVIAKRLMPYKQKTLLAANKVDNATQAAYLHDFYKLGLSDPHPISSLQGQGVEALLSIAVSDFVEIEEAVDPSSLKKIAILGRPNVGKSSFINALLKEDRVIVSDQAGTTRDSVDIVFNYKGESIVLVDTAGIRKKKKVSDGVEYYSVKRSLDAILHSDAVVMILNAEEGLNHQDIKLLDLVLEKGKTLTLVANKWDKMVSSDLEMKTNFKEMVYAVMPQLRYYPVLFVSALKHQGLSKVIDQALLSIENSRKRVSTPKLNTLVTQVIKRNPPPARFGKAVKIYYATQVEIAPPRYVFFVNHQTRVSADYTRFLESKIREYLEGLDGVVIHFHFRSEHGHEEDASLEKKPRRVSTSRRKLKA